jgi:16S rRNA processing protein RimM
MPLVTIGRLGRPHGVRGELQLDGSALSPADLAALRTFTWQAKDGASRSLILESARPNNQRIIVHFAGVTNRDQAAMLVNGALLAEQSALPDPGPGVAYTFQLIGLEVRDTGGRVLGALEDIVKTGAHPIYVVKGEREWLIPAAPEVLLGVDLEARTITVALPAGLEDL